MATDTSAIEDVLSQFTSTETPSLCGAAVVVKGKNGETLFSSATGKLSRKQDSNPFTTDTVGWLASMSKLVTSVAALQQVDRGLVTLDEDLGKHVPYLNKVQILDSFDKDGKPIYANPSAPITLRQLLTHQSGFGYEGSEPKLLQLAKYNGSEPDDAHLEDRMQIPLMFEPGTSFAYGKSVDWAGFMVANIQQTSLEAYMRENIFKPLGMSSTTFFISKRPDLKIRRAEIEQLELEPGLLTSHGSANIEEPDIEVGGGGLFGSASDYSKLLGALISRDSRIFSNDATFDKLFEPQLKGTSAAILQQICETRPYSAIPITVSDIYKPVPVNHSLCGAVMMEDVPGKRKRGSVGWRGMINSDFWIDPQTGIAVVVFLQNWPYNNTDSLQLSARLEEEIYKAWGM
ncbi:hypothetical protein NW762_013196 [Fusarium torreyae]|uniref:Beta-lactamase-related domain-containing protein n=1 Tax=Fusarium torreyae TaxID=1237075 RepID=A0A9W8RP97_9HYPO|nr:hypothetical protein NW762_013196 [Fusarium torreyae]